MTDDKLPMDVSALADGELRPDAARALQAQLEKNPGLKRQLQVYAKLDAAVAAMEVSQLSELAASKIWHEIAQQTVRLTAKDRADFAKLDAAAVTLPTPAADARLEQLWGKIAGRIAADQAAYAEFQNEQVPAVSPEQWNKVWQGVRKNTQPAAVITNTDFTHRGNRWRWVAAASAAASVAVALVLFMFAQGGEQQTAMQVPEVLDERYQVQVKYLEGQDEPVVCFFLKDDLSMNDTQLQSWQWLPD